ncbi:MAG TPA: hypothetical protein VFM91_02780 [Propionibacteriaceae bacterium]|nr:hypothetical protein [Propionibacteriaceae bacterium]
MSTTSRVAGAVAAGYALGRFKKLRMAVLVATAMSSPKLRAAAAGMLQDRLPGGAITSTLTKEVGGKLVNVGKTAATSIVASRIDSLSQSLADRSENLRKASPSGQASKSRAEEPADEYEEQEGEEAEEPADEYEEEEGEEAEEPTDEYEEQEGEEAQEPTDESEEQEASRDEQPEEPVARSPRRRRSASPAGRRRG